MILYNDTSDNGQIIKKVKYGAPDGTTKTIKSIKYNSGKKIEEIYYDWTYLKDLPIGSLVEIWGEYKGEKVRFILGKKSSTSLTLISEKVLCFKCFDAKEPQNPRQDRKTGGNNRYLHSNIRAWLRSSNPQWYQKTHTYDQPPDEINITGKNAYTNEPGFLSFIDAIYLKKGFNSIDLMECDKTGDALREFVEDNVILPGDEVVNGIGLGPITFEIFTDNASRVAYPTAGAVSSAQGLPAGITPDTPVRWMLREPRTRGTNESDIYVINEQGALDKASASDSTIGIRPMIYLSLDTTVRTDVNSFGAHELSEMGIYP